MSVYRVPIQSRELAEAMELMLDGPDTVWRRAAQIVAHLMTGNTVIIEERIGSIGDEDIIEETILEAGAATVTRLTRHAIPVAALLLLALWSAGGER